MTLIILGATALNYGIQSGAVKYENISVKSEFVNLIHYVVSCISPINKAGVIPLNHYIYYHSKYPKKLDKENGKFIMKKSNKLQLLLDNNKIFNDINYHTIQKVKKLNKKCGNTFYSKTSIIHNTINILQKKKIITSIIFCIF